MKQKCRLRFGDQFRCTEPVPLTSPVFAFVFTRCAFQEWRPSYLCFSFADPAASFSSLEAWSSSSFALLA